MIRFLLNGQEVNSPRDYAQFNDELDRDEDKRVIARKYENDVTFTGASYALLKAIDDTQGFCAEVDVEIQDACDGPFVTSARGKIILADAEWSDGEPCEVKCSIVDNGIGSRIDNNKGIPITPTAELSKNSVAIDPVTPLALVMFDTADGTDISGARRAFDWMEAVTHAVAYMTDGEVTVSSEWYAALPDDQRIAVGLGNELRVSGVESPRFVYVWEDLFMEVAKKHNLWIFAGETEAGDPFLLIEPESAFYSEEGDLRIENIAGMIRSIDTDRLYATVKVGSSEYIRELQTGHSLPFVVMLGHSEETFHFTGVCNTDAELDLVNDWIIDNNVIEDLLGGDDSWDEDIFLIQYTAATSKATQGQYLNQGELPSLYNEQFLNYNVLLRYDLPSPVGANYGPVTADMQAEATAAITYPQEYKATPSSSGCGTEHPYQFDDDFTPPNFDTANAWGNGTTPGTPVSEADSRYTANAQGFYSFQVLVNWLIVSSIPSNDYPATSCFYATVGISLQIRVFSALDVQIGPTQTLTDPVFKYLVGNYVSPFNFGASLNVGEYITVTYSLCGFGNISSITAGLPCFNSPTPLPPFTAGAQMKLRPGSTLRTTLIVNGGFVIPDSQSRIQKFEFERHLPLDDWKGIVNSPQDKITIDGPREVHVQNAQRNIETGLTSFTLIRRP